MYEVADGVETFHLEVFVADEPVERLEVQNTFQFLSVLKNRNQNQNTSFL